MTLHNLPFPSFLPFLFFYFSLLFFSCHLTKKGKKERKKENLFSSCSLFFLFFLLLHLFFLFFYLHKTHSKAFYQPFLVLNFLPSTSLLLLLASTCRTISFLLKLSLSLSHLLHTNVTLNSIRHLSCFHHHLFLIKTTHEHSI